MVVILLPSLIIVVKFWKIRPSPGRVGLVSPLPLLLKMVLVRRIGRVGSRRFNGRVTVLSRRVMTFPLLILKLPFRLLKIRRVIFCRPRLIKLVLLLKFRSLPRRFMRWVTFVRLVIVLVKFLMILLLTRRLLLRLGKLSSAFFVEVSVQLNIISLLVLRKNRVVRLSTWVRAFLKSWFWRCRFLLLNFPL